MYPTNPSLGARLHILQARNQGTVGQGLSLRNRNALTVDESIYCAQFHDLGLSQALARSQGASHLPDLQASNLAGLASWTGFHLHEAPAFRQSV